MISIQLAEVFQSIFQAPKPPSQELVRRYERATTGIANSFTLKLTEDDERYLYARFKKVKNDASELLLDVWRQLIQLFRLFWSF